MAKDALIKVRCSPELKNALTVLAARREQDLSAFIRVALIAMLDRETPGWRTNSETFDDRIAAEDQSPYPPVKSPAAPQPTGQPRAHGSLPHDPPAPGATG